MKTVGELRAFAKFHVACGGGVASLDGIGAEAPIEAAFDRLTVGNVDWAIWLIDERPSTEVEGACELLVFFEHETLSMWDSLLYSQHYYGEPWDDRHSRLYTTFCEDRTPAWEVLKGQVTPVVHAWLRGL